ncbi:hypothetical protein AB0H43_12680 [Hamadaea sp. NPDC050747]|uniref:hypothetical protein n=1 Tax=Hamadaea sp. NPDC050747 TaxID=3155789 RepID=UPI0033E3FC6A
MGSVDLDLRHVYLYDGLALTRCAVGKGQNQVGSRLLDGCRVERSRRFLDEFGEVVAAVLELVDFDGEVADAVAAGAFVERAVLERG